MSDLIDRRATKELFCKQCDVIAGIREQICKDSGCWIIKQINEAPTIDAVPIKFIDEVIEYITKCRDYAQLEVCKGAWDERRETLIMLLHEWDAWNECGRTGKYGERRAEWAT